MKSLEKFSGKIDDATREEINAAVRERRYVEAGWRVYSAVVIDKANCPDELLRGVQSAFFAGAQHLFGIIASSDANAAAVEDLDRVLTAVDQELSTFAADAARSRTKGN